ncbi:MAG: outer membrane beta-barrel protein [Chitinophagales bacterium]
MKSITLAAIFIFSVLSFSFAQSNKPIPGQWGIGYQVKFDSGFNQQFQVSYMLNHGWEAGTQIGFYYSHTAATFNDSIDVFTGNETIKGNLETKITTSGSSFSIAPFLVKHCTINNNLDFYAGPIVPVTIGAKNTTINSKEVRAEDYLSVNDQKTKTPPGNSLGLGGVIGSRYFFYTNLAIGAHYSLSGIYSFQKGDETVETTVTNSGSNNPSSGFSFNGTETEKRNSSYLNIETLSNIGLDLTFYF